MKTVTKYYVRYKTKSGKVNPFNPHIKGFSYTFQCIDKNDAMRQGNIMSYDNVRKVEIFSKTYAVILNKNILIKKTCIFPVNIK